MIEAVFKPMTSWPHERTHDWDRRSRSTFKASWVDTLDLLRYELERIDAQSLIIGCGLRGQDIRKDGWPRSNAAAPVFPGVEVSFTSEVNLSPLARRGRELIRRYGSYKDAAKALHPDAGMPTSSVEDFAALSAANDQRRLVYATDTCEFWQHNVRSIALGLKALRDVDRYGISKRGQQYAGFAGVLTSGAIV